MGRKIIDYDYDGTGRDEMEREQILGRHAYLFGLLLVVLDKFRDIFSYAPPFEHLYIW